MQTTSQKAISNFSLEELQTMIRLTRIKLKNVRLLSTRKALKRVTEDLNSELQRRLFADIEESKQDVRETKLMDIFIEYSADYNEMGFNPMVELFANDAFYKCHEIAKEFLRHRTESV